MRSNHCDVESSVGISSLKSEVSPLPADKYKSVALAATVTRRKLMLCQPSARDMLRASKRLTASNAETCPQIASVRSRKCRPRGTNATAMTVHTNPVHRNGSATHAAASKKPVPMTVEALLANWSTRSAREPSLSSNRPSR